MKNYTIYYYVGTYTDVFFCFRKREECNVNNTKRLTFWCNALKRKTKNSTKWKCASLYM